ncbi:hypothetical protein KQI41_12190 [Tissierella pigra]|uniref:hypothetical protein n=1 Tax=Tissierella pigra TaxID=2607614 RepID=UPI001C0FB1C2|nr:hypothetical protein [Tissierella pigra]MBU5427176.1 hypothetical protein [Tissierella pigra]
MAFQIKIYNPILVTEDKDMIEIYKFMDIKTVCNYGDNKKDRYYGIEINKDKILPKYINSVEAGDSVLKNISKDRMEFLRTLSDEEEFHSHFKNVFGKLQLEYNKL